MYEQITYTIREESNTFSPLVSVSLGVLQSYPSLMKPNPIPGEAETVGD
jgi:hypothetical protein